MAGFKDLFKQYSQKQAAVKAGTEELEEVKAQVSGLEKQVAETQKELKALKPKVEEALVAEIKARRADLAKAKKAMDAGDFEAANRLVRHEKPVEKQILADVEAQKEEPSEKKRLVESYFKPTRYATNFLRDLQFKEFNDGSVLVKSKEHQINTVDSALAAIVYLGCGKWEEAEKLIKGIEMHVPKTKEGLYSRRYEGYSQSGSTCSYQNAAVALAYGLMREFEKAEQLVKLLEKRKRSKDLLITTWGESGGDMGVADTASNALLGAVHVGAFGSKRRCYDYVTEICRVIGKDHSGLVKGNTSNYAANKTSNAALAVAYRCWEKHEEADELMKAIDKEFKKFERFDADALYAIADMMRK